MHEITGDKNFVLKLLKDTSDNLAVRRPRPAASAKGKKAAAKKEPKESVTQTERDQVIEQFQRAHERAQLAPTAAPSGAKKAGGKRAKAAFSLTSTVVEEAWYAPRDRTIALFQSAMNEYLKQQTGKPAAKGAKGASGAKSSKRKSAGSAKKVSRADAKKSFYAERVPTSKAKSLKKKALSGAKTAKAIIEEKYDVLDPGWLTIALEKAKLLFKGKRKFVKHSSASDLRYALADGARVALLSDWGGGNEHAQAVAGQVGLRKPDHCIHLGDVYYSGTKEEVEEHFLRYWPAPAPPGRSFALNANHEMYSGGYGYFDVILKGFGQKASYFSLGNERVRLIGLDTGYVEHNLNKEQLEWLDVLLNEGDAKNILLSHHQPFSAFESGGAGEHRLQQWLKPYMDAGKITAWFWGHEHLLALYKPYMKIKGRCIGNGCFPYGLPPATPPYAGPQVEWYSRRSDPKRPKRGVHSFAMLTVDGADVHVEYIDQDGQTARAETL